MSLAKIYIFAKKNKYINKLSDIKLLKQPEDTIVYKAGDNVFKCESKIFLNLYLNIKKLYNRNNSYIRNYKLGIEPNIFYYKFVPGSSLENYFFKKYKPNKKIIIDNIIRFIKYNIKIKESEFCNISFSSFKKYPPLWQRYSADNSNYCSLLGYDKSIVVSNGIYFKLTKKEQKLVYDLRKIYNICIVKQKKTKNKIIVFNDLNAHNIIIDAKYNINQIDLTDGFKFGNFNLYIYRYFALLWIFGEKAVDKAINDCDLSECEIFVKELSFLYFHNYFLEKLKTDKIERYFFNIKCNNYCKKIILSLTKKYPEFI
tara:strand:+ start:114 stop:1055 length:942 start_codon:yes stop_codon:yes gene_type:complete